MHMIFIEYPTCSTCKKAKKYLLHKGVSLEVRNIVEQTPTEDELTTWYHGSNLELKNFFNTSGNLYKELQLKDKRRNMSEQEQIKLLASNGMLLKRPMLIHNGKLQMGFKEEIYEKLCSDC